MFRGYYLIMDEFVEKNIGFKDQTHSTRSKKRKLDAPARQIAKQQADTDIYEMLRNKSSETNNGFKML